MQVPALPLYIALANSGCSNTYFAMMVPFFLSVFAIFLFRQFFKSFPDDIIHAARLDGMNEFEIVWRIVGRARGRPSPPSPCSRSSRTGTTCTGR